MFDVDPLGLLTREVLRERAAALVREVCAWSVGLSDQPHTLRHRGRLVHTGVTMGVRAASGLPLSGEEDGRLELGDARPGSFQDALNALAPDGTVYADRLDSDVMEPFVLETCLVAARRAREQRSPAWSELVAEVGEDDPAEVVRAAEWEAPLRIEAEHLVLAALAAVPLLDVEAEGVPLSLVRAAEALTRDAVQPEPEPAADELAGAIFLAEVALREARLTVPVPPAEADRLLEALLAEGVQLDEVGPLLAHLPVEPATAAEVRATVAAMGAGG